MIRSPTDRPIGASVERERPADPSPPAWLIEAAQLLEEHHLAACSTDEAARVRFGADAAMFLGALPDTQVCVLHGAHIHDLYSFCSQFERALGTAPLKRRIDGPGGVVSAMRRRGRSASGRALKRRFYIWHDADLLLRIDRSLFNRLVDAMIGVAAESEYSSEDLLLLHRTVFIGGSTLEMYAEDELGQFRSWYSEGEEKPFWGVVSGVSRPPVLRYRIPGSHFQSDSSSTSR